MSVETNILLSLSNLISEAISMGVGDLISSYAEAQYLLGRREAERQRFNANRDKRRQEMKEVLQGKGFKQEDAGELIDILSKDSHADFFVDFCVSEDLGLEIPDDPWAPFKDGLVTFLAFILFGCIPLLVYIILWGAKYNNAWGIFGISCAATAITLFALGATQGKITMQPQMKMGVLMTLNGSLAAAAAYLIGWGISSAFGDSMAC